MALNLAWETLSNELWNLFRFCILVVFAQATLLLQDWPSFTLFQLAPGPFISYAWNSMPAEYLPPSLPPSILYPFQVNLIKKCFSWFCPSSGFPRCFPVFLFVCNWGFFSLHVHSVIYAESCCFPIPWAQGPCCLLTSFELAVSQWCGEVLAHRWHARSVCMIN